MLNHYLYEREMQSKHREALRQAEQRRLLRQARNAQRRWLPRPGCWLLRHLGRLLVSLGQQLQHYAQPGSASLEGQINN
jgi:hypothetical protein